MNTKSGIQRATTVSEVRGQLAITISTTQVATNEEVYNALTSGPAWWALDGVEIKQRGEADKLLPDRDGSPINHALAGGKMTFHIGEGERSKTIGRDELIEGLKMAVNRMGFDRVIGDPDAFSTDIALQYACFGEVVFG